MLLSRDFLNDTERKQVYDAVHSLQQHWISRETGMDLPFFSLGRAAYMDLIQNRDPNFNQLTIESNKLLWSKFEWLYEKLRLNVQEQFGIPARYDLENQYNLALPGFHIFQADWFFEEPFAAIHCDIQYQDIDWHGAEIDVSQCLSLTASIALPSSGGGLNTWDVSYDKVQDLDEAALQEYMADKPMVKYYPYQEGGINYHFGHLFHQIAPMTDVQNEDERITLQGHGVVIDGEYILYW